MSSIIYNSVRLQLAKRCAVNHAVSQLEKRCLYRQNIRVVSREKEIQSPTTTMNPTAVKSKILTKGNVPVFCSNLQVTDAATKYSVVAVKTVKPILLSCTMMISSALLNEMDLVEARMRMRNNAASRLTTRFSSTPDIDMITPTMEIQAPAATVVRKDSKILVESSLAEPPVAYVILQDVEMTDSAVAVKTVKPRRLPCTIISPALLNEMNLVEAKMRMSNNAGGRLITTRFSSMPDIDVIMDPVMAVKTVKPRRLSCTMILSALLNEMDLVEAKIRMSNNAGGRLITTCFSSMPDIDVIMVMAVKTVKPRRLSCTMDSSALLDEMDLVEAKIRVRSYAEVQQPKRFISTPNIEVRTHTVEIRAPHDTTVQTELKTLTIPTVTVVHAGKPDTVVITENTVKPKHRSLWSRIKKAFRCVLCLMQSHCCCDRCFIQLIYLITL